MFGQIFGRRAPLVLPPLDLPRSDLSIINEAKHDEFVDVDALAAALGLDVELQPYRAELCGTLQRIGKRWIIGVNRADPLNRRRFTIAHEIGHYVMHRDLVAKRPGVPGIADTHGYRQPDIPELANAHVLPHHDTQANRIAIMILMDEGKMRRLMAEGIAVEHIAMLIGCSIEATRIRVDGLTGVRAKH